MRTVSLRDVEKVQVEMEGAEGAYRQLPIGSPDGAPNFSFRVFTVEPGGYTPHHRHPYEHVNYVISGEGVLVDEAGRETEIAEGDFALVMPDEMHQYRNRSESRDMVMICAVPKEHE
jgi:quercetin dioxygenase-like cupin family protein